MDGAPSLFPTLPVEVSRGCWWRDTAGGAGRGCAFCNLSRQWAGYRAKTPRRAAAEIDILTERYRTLSLALTDNLLPVRCAPALGRELGALEKDLQLFGELRATTPAGTLAALRAAGMDTAQVGIEALSSRLLARLNKGTTAVRNLEIMRDCEALGIRHESNLILGFPGSDDRDVAETLRVLAFAAAAFRPLKCVRFWLGAGSTVWAEPRRFGIRAVSRHPRYGVLFPRDVARAVDFPVKSYRGDRQAQQRRWRPVEAAVRRWRRHYEDLKRRSPGQAEAGLSSFTSATEIERSRSRAAWRTSASESFWITLVRTSLFDSSATAFMRTLGSERAILGTNRSLNFMV